MTEAQFTAQVARIEATADRLARQIGARFIVNERKLSDYRARALSSLTGETG